MHSMVVIILPLLVVARAHAEHLLVEQKETEQHSIDEIISKLVDKFQRRQMKVFPSDRLNKTMLGTIREPGSRIGLHSGRRLVSRTMSPRRRNMPRSRSMPRTGGRMGGRQFGRSQQNEQRRREQRVGAAAPAANSPINLHVHSHHSPFGGVFNPHFLSGLLFRRLFHLPYHHRGYGYGHRHHGYDYGHHDVDLTRVFATVTAGALAGTAATFTIWQGDITAGVFTGAAAASVVWNMLGDRVPEAIHHSLHTSPYVRETTDSFDASLPRTEGRPTIPNVNEAADDTGVATSSQEPDLETLIAENARLKKQLGQLPVDIEKKPHASLPAA